MKSLNLNLKNNLILKNLSNIYIFRLIKTTTMSKKLLRITRRGLRRNTCLEVVFVLLTFETDVTKRSTTFFCYKREEENAYLLNDEN